MPEPKLTDAELVRLAAEHDEAAWEEIVRRFSPRIFALAVRFSNAGSPPEDLTQDVFVRLFRRLYQYHPAAGRLENWVMRLARNLMIDVYRARRREWTTDQLDDVSELEDEETKTRRSDCIRLDDLCTEVRRYLSPQQSQVFEGYKCFLGNKDIPSLALELGVGEKRVEGLITEIKRICKEAGARYYERI